MKTNNMKEIENNIDQALKNGKKWVSAPSNINQDEMSFLCQKLKENPQIEHLDLMYNKMDLRTFEVLCDELKANNLPIKGLKLNGANLYDSSNSLSPQMQQEMKINLISQVIEKNTTLQELGLQDSKIGNDGCKHISQALKENKSLKKLNLGLNQIEDSGCQLISQALEKNTSLAELLLFSNRIKEEGYKHISDALEKNKSLRTLDIENNSGITEKGKQYIADIIGKDTGLTSFKIKYTGLKQPQFKAIDDKLKQNFTMRDLGEFNLQNVAHEPHNESVAPTKKISNHLQRNQELHAASLAETKVFDKKISPQLVVQAKEIQADLMMHLGNKDYNAGNRNDPIQKLDQSIAELDKKAEARKNKKDGGINK